MVSDEERRGNGDARGTVHIHIASVGTSIESVTRCVNALRGIDKVYLLFTPSSVGATERVMQAFGPMGVPSVPVQIGGTDFQEIVDQVYRIYRLEHGREVGISINITGGNNLVAAAMCSCAYFIGADIYYVVPDDGRPVIDQVVRIPVPNVSDVGRMGERTRAILLFVEERTRRGEVLCNSEVTERFGAAKQNTGYHLNILKEMGLVSIDRGFRNPDGSMDMRRNSVNLTPRGRLVSCWLREGRNRSGIEKGAGLKSSRAQEDDRSRMPKHPCCGYHMAGPSARSVPSAMPRPQADEPRPAIKPCTLPYPQGRFYNCGHRSGSLSSGIRASSARRIRSCTRCP